MTYDLILGDYAYSSWSLRSWLLFEKFDIPRKVHRVSFHNAASVADQMPEFAPARTVPTLRTPEGAIVSDSLAIAEELASRHPDAGIWPSDPLARATARALCAEMHSGFTSLREDCPMNLRTAYVDSQPSQAVLDNVARIDTLWAHARQMTSTHEPWLFGAYSAADAFFAPVAARIAGYNLPVSSQAHAYVQAHLGDLAFRRWRAMGLVRGETLSRYAKSHPTTNWPGPQPLDAHICDGIPENATCPYSGDPSTDMLQLNGRVFGFCNAFCRDKTLADPEAWPAFMALI